MEEKEKITLAILGEKLDSLILGNKEEHAKIIDQTTKTNGRVSKLENWRFLLIGGWGMLVIIVIPIALAMLKNWK
jgi:hypothetical protein